MFSSTPGSLASATNAALARALCASTASGSLSTTSSSQLVSHSSSASALPKRPSPITSTFLWVNYPPSTNQQPLLRQLETARLGFHRKCQRQGQGPNSTGEH